VKEYWIVNPDTKTVKTFVLKDEKYQVVDYYNTAGVTIPINIFPGVSLQYDDVFYNV